MINNNNLYLIFPSFKATLGELITLSKTGLNTKEVDLLILDYFPVVYFRSFVKKYGIRKLVESYKLLKTQNIIIHSSQKNLLDKFMTIKFNTPLKLLEENFKFYQPKLENLYKYAFNIFRTNGIEIEFNDIKKIIDHSYKENSLDTEILYKFLQKLNMETSKTNHIIKNLTKKHLFRENIGHYEYALFIVATVIFSKYENVYIPDDKKSYFYLIKAVYNYLKPKISLAELPNLRLVKSYTLPDIKGYGIFNFPENQIFLDDTKKQIENKIFKIRSDNKKEKKTDKGNPENCTVFEYLKAFLNEDKSKDIENLCRSGKIGCVECRRFVFEQVMKYI